MLISVLNRSYDQDIESVGFKSSTLPSLSHGENLRMSAHKFAIKVLNGLANHLKFNLNRLEEKITAENSQAKCSLDVWNAKRDKLIMYNDFMGLNGVIEWYCSPARVTPDKTTLSENNPKVPTDEESNTHTTILDCSVIGRSNRSVTLTLYIGSEQHDRRRAGRCAVGVVTWCLVIMVTITPCCRQHDNWSQCWLNVGPASVTLAQHWVSIGPLFLSSCRPRSCRWRVLGAVNPTNCIKIPPTHRGL